MSDSPYYSGKNFKNRKSTDPDARRTDIVEPENDVDENSQQNSQIDLEEIIDDEKLHLFKRVRIGRTNVLRVVKRLPFGAYLSAGSAKEEILLPKRYEPEDCKVDDLLKVFIYYDSEDRIIATTEIPLAQVDECAFLKVVDVNKVGAFMDIGLMKDLFVPYAEQETPMEKGKFYVVRTYLDEHSGRIMASSKLDKFLLEESQSHQAEQAVDLIIYAETELGYKAVVGTTYIGLLYKNELLAPLKIGDKVQGYIKTVRTDKKLDLTLQQPSQKTRGDLANQILDFIKEQGGSSTLTDKSPPEAIYQQFKVSKKAYKKALGALYKRRLILIDKDVIQLTSK